VFMSRFHGPIVARVMVHVNHTGETRDKHYLISPLVPARRIGKLLIAAFFESKRKLAVRASCFGEKNSLH
jgi:hypothetical protein